MALTLGIHIGHDGGTAICRDGEIVVACAEERLTRKKYANGWWSSLNYCLREASASLSDFDLVVFSNSGEPLPDGFDGDLGHWTQRSLRTVNLDHHLSHAIGAFCFSPFEDGLVHVADAGGNHNETESFYLFNRFGWEKKSETSASRERSKGLGTTYEAFTNYLGFADQESGKTMGLAAYGAPERFEGLSLFEVGRDAGISSVLEHSHYWGVEEFSKRNGDCFAEKFPSAFSQIAKDIAAFVQKEIEDALVTSIRRKVEELGSTNLVMSGGVALNCVANQKLSDEFGPERVFVFPACSDCGLAIGNALYGVWALEGFLPKPSDRSFRFGRRYVESDLVLALGRHPDTVPPGSMRHGDISWEYRSDKNQVASEFLCSGKLLGWWQGRSETGPRALGGRSILGSPKTTGIRDLLNKKVKNREWFRPLAPSVLMGQVEAMTHGTVGSPYMNMAPTLSEHGRQAIPECVHVDGSARIQSVSSELAPELYALLMEFRRIGEVPAVLNTSFNVREPIVETPGDAIATFLRSNLDAMFLENYLVRRVFP